MIISFSLLGNDTNHPEKNNLLYSHVRTSYKNVRNEYDLFTTGFYDEQPILLHPSHAPCVQLR